MTSLQVIRNQEQLKGQQCHLCLSQDAELYQMPCRCNNLIHLDCLRLLIKNQRKHSQRIKQSLSGQSQKVKQEELLCKTCGQYIPYTIQQSKRCRKWSQYKSQEKMGFIILLFLFFGWIAVGIYGIIAAVISNDYWMLAIFFSIQLMGLITIYCFINEMRPGAIKVELQNQLNKRQKPKQKQSIFSEQILDVI